MCKGLIAYFRVSTDKQGRSGLGLLAQEQAIAGTCQPDSDRSLKISVDFAAVPLAADSVGKFTTL